MDITGLPEAGAQFLIGYFNNPDFLGRAGWYLGPKGKVEASAGIPIARVTRSVAFKEQPEHTICYKLEMFHDTLLFGEDEIRTDMERAMILTGSGPLRKRPLEPFFTQEEINLVLSKILS